MGGSVFQVQEMRFGTLRDRSGKDYLFKRELHIASRKNFNLSDYRLARKVAYTATLVLVATKARAGGTRGTQQLLLTNSAKHKPYNKICAAAIAIPKWSGDFR